jgi:hypothetical protein
MKVVTWKGLLKNSSLFKHVINLLIAYNCTLEPVVYLLLPDK